MGALPARRPVAGHPARRSVDPRRAQRCPRLDLRLLGGRGLQRRPAPLRRGRRHRRRPGDAGGRPLRHDPRPRRLGGGEPERPHPRRPRGRRGGRQRRRPRHAGAAAVGCRRPSGHLHRGGGTPSGARDRRRDRRPPLLDRTHRSRRPRGPDHRRRDAHTGVLSRPRPRGAAARQGGRGTGGDPYPSGGQTTGAGPGRGRPRLRLGRGHRADATRAPGRGR